MRKVTKSSQAENAPRNETKGESTQEANPSGEQLKEQAKEQPTNGGGGKSAQNTAKAAREGGGQENERSTSNQDSKEAVGGGEVIVTGNEFGEYKDIKELRKKAVQYYSEHLQGTSVENTALGKIDIDANGLVSFTGAGKREMKSTSAKENKLLLVKYLPDLIRNATDITSSDAVKERHANETFYYLHATAKIKGEETPVEITLVKRNDGNIQYYNHILPTEEKRKDTSVSPEPESPKGALGTPAVDVSSVGSSIPQQKAKRNEKIGFFSVGKTGKKFTATLEESLGGEYAKDHAEAIDTLAESFGGKGKDGTYTFGTKREWDGFLECANAYIALQKSQGNLDASASAEAKRIREIVGGMKIVPVEEYSKLNTMLSNLGESMGCPIVWVDASSQLDGVHCNGVTFLNRNAGMDLVKTFWHEQFHLKFLPPLG